MKNQKSVKQLTAKLVKSNASENLVWEIAVSNSRSKKHYCKTACKALCLLFILKKDTNLPIDYDSLRHLKNVIAKRKAATSKENKSTEAQ